jgi:hypothetical protein
LLKSFIWDWWYCNWSFVALSGSFFYFSLISPHCNLDETNPTTPLEDKCDILNSSLINLFGVVGFVSSRSFWWYRWCHNWSFGVPLGSLSLFFPFLSSYVHSISLFFKMSWFWITRSLSVVFSNHDMYKLYYFTIFLKSCYFINI